MTPLKVLAGQYDALKRAAGDDAKSQAVAIVLANLAEVSAEFLLGKCRRVELVSKVPGKNYFAFGGGKEKISRAVNLKFPGDFERIH